MVEVAVSSLKKDRDVKAPLYAASRFAEYWIFNVPARTVEVFRTPADGVYQDISRHESGAVLAVQAFPDVSIPTVALFE